LIDIMLFYPARKQNTYFFDGEGKHVLDYPENKNLSLPIEIDTEYQSITLKEQLNGEVVHHHDGLRIPITTQVKGIKENFNDAVILAASSLEHYIGIENVRHDRVKTYFHVVDWLKTKGFKVGLIKPEAKHKGKRLPYIQIDIFAYFALADIGMVFDGDLHAEIMNHFKRGNLSMNRRLRSTTTYKGREYDHLSLKSALLRIEGRTYKIRISLHDICAIHGQSSLANFYQNAGIETTIKKSLDDYKSRMLTAYTELPEVYDEYAKGDLRLYEALERNRDLDYKIYRTLGLQDYFEAPKLTMGATTATLLRSAIANHFDCDNPRELMDEINLYARATYLRQNVNSTSALASKVRGGRCRNNRPTDTVVNALICDLDISGCYGDGQRNQIFPFGRPIIESWEFTNKNRYPILRDWYQARKHELVDGCWIAIISSRYLGSHKDEISKRTQYETLEYPQDFFESWYGFTQKQLLEIVSDTETLEQDYLDTKTGETKIFNHQIINGLLTSDGYDWIDNCTSQSQRKELLEKLEVIAAIYYPKSKRCTSKDEFLEHLRSDEERNEQLTIIKESHCEIITYNQNCHAWYGINLGDLLTDELMINRKKYPKKTPLNTLYKLKINTIYGNLVSPFFDIGNVVVGNNITARARLLCWSMEKGLHGFQSITDGCAFELNGVLKPKKGRKLKANALANLHLDDDIGHNLHIKRMSLGGKKWALKEWNKDDAVILHGDEKLSLNQALERINVLAMKHLQSLFDLKVLKQSSTSLKVKANLESGELISVDRKQRTGLFEFEAKSIYDRGIFHGSSNYLFYQGNEARTLKMRAYTDKPHIGVYESEEGFLEIDEACTISPCKKFIENLSNKDQSIPRQNPYIKSMILKPSLYRERLKTFEGIGVLPGDNFYAPILIRELSLSQFTFQTLEQRLSIEREAQSNKRKYHQTYEMHFSTASKIAYQNMIEVIADAVTKQRLFALNEYLGGFDKSQLDYSHPKKRLLLATRELIYKPKAQLDYFDDDDVLEPIESADIAVFDGDLDFDL